MLRNFAALTILAVAGTLLLPDVSAAGVGGLRAGGIRASGVQLPPGPRNARAGILRHRPGGVSVTRLNRAMSHRQLSTATHVRIPPAATSAVNVLSRYRLSHRGSIGGWAFPFTTDAGTGYIGTPYDPTEAIPVYGPYPSEDWAVPVARAAGPRLTNATEENANQDACRSERVTVPASEGEREILVVRC